MRVAPEGRDIVTVIALAMLVFWIFGLGILAWASLLALLFALQFFRDPRRECFAQEGEALSAADGRVVFVGVAPSPAAGGGDALKIGVFMSPFNVHANRAPVGGTVAESRRIAGKFFNASLDKASAENERHLIVIENPKGTVACMQVAGFLARRVLCSAKVGDALTAGQRYGFIRFGSRADVYLPQDWLPLVAAGDRVKAGLTRLARAPGL